MRIDRQGTLSHFRAPEKPEKVKIHNKQINKTPLKSKPSHIQMIKAQNNAFKILRKPEILYPDYSPPECKCRKKNLQKFKIPKKILPAAI